jgi:hypothetical protein
MRLSKALLISALSLTIATSAFAGPIIIAGTDADDHGSVAGTNQNGWLFMQNAFQNLAPAVSNGNTNIVCIGCNAGGAFNAFDSAVNLSTIAGTWDEFVLTNAADITTFMTGGTTPGGLSLANTGIIYMPTGEGNVGGGISGAQLAPVNANATALNNFIIGGGGLFTQEQQFVAGGYGWLTTLLPGLNVHGDNDGTIANPSSLTLTSDGIAAFPGISNATMSNATPWHAWFDGNLGNLDVLVTGPAFSGGQTINGAVVLGGGAGGAIICGVPGAPPCPPPPSGAPEPSTMLLMGAAVVGLYARHRKMQQ